MFRTKKENLILHSHQNYTLFQFSIEEEWIGHTKCDYYSSTDKREDYQYEKINLELEPLWILLNKLVKKKN